MPLTAYPAPADAIFVAPDGRDRGPGTRARPLRSVAAALRRAPPGGTVVLRAGTYREALGEIATPVTLQPAPGETAWLKGSRVVTRWRREGDVWLHEPAGRPTGGGDGWRPFCADCVHPGNVDPAHPLAGRPDQVWVDGRPLQQVAGAEAVGPGTFAAIGTGAGGTLVIGTDPAGRAVEAAVHERALTVRRGGEGTRIRGLGWAHYAPVAQPGLGGMVTLDAARVTVEDCVFAWSAVKGLSVFAADVAVRGSTFAHNGMMGLAAWRADRLVVENNRFAHNNREGFAQTGAVSEAAGAKITVARDVRVADNVFERNRANGLWLDIDVTNATVVRNRMAGNARHGLFFEISAGAVIASNVVAANGVSGIALADSTGARVWNNTLLANPIALLVQDDDRVNDDPAARARGLTWQSGDHAFHNNVVAGGRFAWVRDYTGRLAPETMLPRSDRNAYRPSGVAPDGAAVEWWRDGRRELLDFAAWQARGRDEASLLLGAPDLSDDALSDNALSDDAALPPGSPARGAGRDLPPAIARAIGVGPRAPDMGALLGPGGVPITR